MFCWEHSERILKICQHLICYHGLSQHIDCIVPLRPPSSGYWPTLYWQLTDVASLALVDLFAAFEALIPQCFLQQLLISYGIDGMAWKWFRSYLWDHFLYASYIWNIENSPDAIRRSTGISPKLVQFCLFYTLQMPVDWVPQSSCTSVCWWHASVRFQSAVISWPATDTHVGLHLWSSELDVIEQSSAQCQQDRDAVVHDSSATESATYLTSDYVTPSTAVRDLCILLDWCHYAVLLWHFETVTHYMALSIAVCLSVSCCGVGAEEAWLWKCYTGQYPIVSTGLPPGGNECSSPTCLPDRQVANDLSSRQIAKINPLLCRLHWFRAPQRKRISFKLAVMVYQCTWTGLTGWCPSASWRDSWSSSVVIVDFGIGCSTYTTVHCRRPSFPHHCGTNMEQFASWSDVINSLQISFVLGVLSGAYFDCKF